MVNFTENKYKDMWFRHPITGEASFDTFKRYACNPIHIGEPKYEWSVNCSQFRDPVSGNLYAYISRYSRGYWGSPINCIAYRSIDNGSTWEYVGVVLEASNSLFDWKDGKQGGAADICVVYDNGAYHAVYGWATHDNKDGGLAYAKSDSPEGPFNIWPVPVHRESEQQVLFGRYKRVYASCLVRREKDWLVLAMMSTPGNAGGSWAFVSMTAKNPEGPYTSSQFVLYPQGGMYHPPIVEYLPPFEYQGYVYAPFTSVALNRSFQVIYKAKKELAHLPDTWEIFKHGSVWHTEDNEYEAQGIWGQAYAGLVEENGFFNVIYPSKNSKDLGTINMASCKWNEIDAGEGFWLSAPKGPSMTFVKKHFEEFELYAELQSRGRKTVFWSNNAPIGPDSTTADSSPHPFMLKDMMRLECKNGEWRILQADVTGQVTEIGTGSYKESGTLEDRIQITCNCKNTKVFVNDDMVWCKEIPAKKGCIGLFAEKGSNVFVKKFSVNGPAKECQLSYIFSEGLIGAGEGEISPLFLDLKDNSGGPEKIKHWQRKTGELYRYGIGYETDVQGSIVKWNYLGSDFRLWSPKGPGLGRANIYLDGVLQTVLDLKSNDNEKSQPIYESKGMEAGYHAVLMELIDGSIVCDSFDFNV